MCRWLCAGQPSRQGHGRVTEVACRLSQAAASCAEGEEEHAAWLQKAAQSHAALARAARQRANALAYIGRWVGRAVNRLPVLPFLHCDQCVECRQPLELLAILILSVIL